MTNGSKKIAKVACGVEAFHALVHFYFWLSETTVTAFGITETPKVHKAGAIGNAAIALSLGIYAWGMPSRRKPS